MRRTGFFCFEFSGENQAYSASSSHFSYSSSSSAAISAFSLLNFTHSATFVAIIGQPVTEFVNATIYEQVNDENDNPVEYYVDMAAFNDGDILRAQDSATTYQIGETVPLQGVYCINKGYAVFRKIQIIDQNAEYSIIKKQTQYGISQYDYIVENASTVSEEDIVH